MRDGTFGSFMGLDRLMKRSASRSRAEPPVVRPARCPVRDCPCALKADGGCHLFRSGGRGSAGASTAYRVRRKERCRGGVAPLLASLFRTAARGRIRTSSRGVAVLISDAIARSFSSNIGARRKSHARTVRLTPQTLPPASSHNMIHTCIGPDVARAPLQRTLMYHRTYRLYFLGRQFR